MDDQKVLTEEYYQKDKYVFFLIKRIVAFMAIENLCGRGFDSKGKKFFTVVIKLCHHFLEILKRKNIYVVYSLYDFALSEIVEEIFNQLVNDRYIRLTIQGEYYTMDNEEDISEVSRIQLYFDLNNLLLLWDEKKSAIYQALLKLKEWNFSNIRSEYVLGVIRRMIRNRLDENINFNISDTMMPWYDPYYVDYPNNTLGIFSIDIDQYAEIPDEPNHRYYLVPQEIPTGYTEFRVKQEKVIECQNDICPVCQEEFKDTDMLYRFKCGFHCVHVDCFHIFGEKYGMPCPLCKMESDILLQGTLRKNYFNK